MHGRRPSAATSPRGTLSSSGAPSPGSPLAAARNLSRAPRMSPTIAVTSTATFLTPMELQLAVSWVRRRLFFTVVYVLALILMVPAIAQAIPWTVLITVLLHPPPHGLARPTGAAPPCARAGTHLAGAGSTTRGRGARPLVFATAALFTTGRVRWAVRETLRCERTRLCHHVGALLARISSWTSRTTSARLSALSGDGLACYRASAKASSRTGGRIQARRRRRRRRKTKEQDMSIPFATDGCSSGANGMPSEPWTSASSFLFPLTPRTTEAGVLAEVHMRIAELTAGGVTISWTSASTLLLPTRFG